MTPLEPISNLNLQQLINIIDIYTPPPTFNKQEQKEIIQTGISLLQDFILENPLCFSNPDIQDILIDNILELLFDQLDQLYEYNIKEDLEILIHKALKIFYSKIVPRRSYNKTFIRYSNNNTKMKKQLEYLQNKPQPEQRTEEWYKFRQSVLTASNAWKAFGTQATQNQLIYEKCLPLNIKKYTNNVPTDSPLHWGQKYEPVSVLLYENMYGTKIEDYGCISHDKYDFIAASPDGINNDTESLLYGRMLEIKNIVNRIITGIPKIEYWIQMQLQMETCNLNECDFLETKFNEYESKEDFMNDGSFTHTESGDPKGIILYFMKNNQYHYEYAPLYITPEEYEKWETGIMEKMEKIANTTWIKTIYWYLYEMSCVLVLKNNLWVKNAIPQLENIWNIIKKERISGYEHRAPNRKIKKENDSIAIKKLSKCFINIDTIKLDDTPLSNSSSTGMKNSFSQESLTIIPANNP
jgi:putative phage-type endonuclease